VSSLEIDLQQRIALIKANIKDPPQWILCIEEQLNDYYKIDKKDIDDRKDFILENSGFSIALISSKCIKDTTNWITQDDCMFLNILKF